MAAVSSTIVSTTESIRNTAASRILAKTVIGALCDSGTAKHVEFDEKEARRTRWQLRLAKAGKEGRIKAQVVANPETGEALVLHTSPRQERWHQLKETSPISREVPKLNGACQESDNSAMSSLHSVTSAVAPLFDEIETACVLRTM